MPSTQPPLPPKRSPYDLEDEVPFTPMRSGAALRRWVLIAAGMLLVLIVVKALNREGGAQDGLWLVFRWPLLALAVVGGPLLLWRLTRRNTHNTAEKSSAGRSDPSDHAAQ